MKHTTISGCSIFLLCLVMQLQTACTKTFLDLNPDKSKVIPASIQDFQAMPDNDSRVNSGLPSAGEEASDNGWMEDANWQALSTVTLRNIYIWDRDVFNDNDRN